MMDFSSNVLQAGKTPSLPLPWPLCWHQKTAKYEVTDQVRDRQRAEALVQELKEASRAKDEFLAMLGHELRNPLAPILTALELIQLRGCTYFERECAIIQRQIKHVVHLVDDLLEVSRLTRGMVCLDRAPCNLAKVVAKAIEMASPLLHQRQHQLTVNVAPGLVVEGDATRLAQVLANLLTNAAKYTAPPAGRRGAAGS